MDEKDCKPGLSLPKISEKHVAVVGLVIIACLSAWMLKVDSVPIITGACGAIGGFIAGDS